MNNAPYLSLVTSSRNDEHGGDMRRRMQTSLSSFISQTEKYGLRSEVILVDYNPPIDKPLLKDTLSLPEKTKYCTVRTIIVTPEIHKQYKDSDKLPFNVFVAQNAGLRRARGEFVQLSPIDNLFSNELIEFIAKERLRKGKLYRADRLDVSKKAVEIQAVDDRFKFCKENITMIFSKFGAIPIIRKKKRHFRTRNQDFNKKDKELPKLHTNGPDLLLMDRESWYFLRGFPEMDIVGLHVDGLLCYMAYFSGIKEEILPEECCVYHIIHGSRWRDTEPSLFEKALFYCFPDEFVVVTIPSILKRLKLFRPIKRLFFPNYNKLDNIGVKYLTLDGYWKIINEMKKGERPVVFNNESWGLGNEELEEHLIVKAEWEQ